jgi:hypothetical protein
MSKKNNSAFLIIGLAIWLSISATGQIRKKMDFSLRNLKQPINQTEKKATPAKIEILSFDLGRRLEGMNTFKTTLRNNSSLSESVILDIRSSHGKHYPGWQRQFPYSLKPGEIKILEESYEIFDINKDSFFRISLYNPQRNEGCDANNLFFEKKYPYERAKEYKEPLINVFDEKAISLWEEKPHSYLDKIIYKGKVHLDSVDLGEIQWGANKYSMRIKNLTVSQLNIKLNLWALYETSRGAISVFKEFILNPEELKNLEGWYLISLDHGKLKIVLTIIDSEEKVLARKSFEYFTPIPNKKRGNLVSVYHKTYPPFNYAESKHFVVYFAPHSKAENDTDTFIKQREEILSSILKIFDVSFDEKIIIFLYPTSCTKISFTYHGGWGLAYKNTIAEEYINGPSVDPYHELTHVVSRKLGHPPALFNEGLAVYMQKGSQWEGRDVDSICAEYLSKGSLISLNELIGYTDIGPEESQPEISYPEAGSFVKFFIQAFGMEKFKTLYGRLKNSSDPQQQSDNTRNIEDLCGRSLAALEKDWIAYLRKQTYE